MSDLQLIESTLVRAAQRRRWERAFRGLFQGLFVGAVLYLIALAAYKVMPLPAWWLTAAAGLGLLATAAGFIATGWRRTTLAETARWIDGKQRLQERLSSALEFGQGQNTSAWQQLIVTDAIQHAKQIDPKKLVPYRLPRVSRWAFALIALSIGLGFVPMYRSKAFLQNQADAKNIKEAGKQLAEMTKRSLESRPPVLEPTQKAMDAVGVLGDQLTKQNLTRSEALKDLAKVTDQVKDQLKDMAKDPAIKRMEQASRAPGGQTTPEMAKLQKQIEEAQKQLGTPTATPDDMAKLQKQMEKIQEAAKAAADKNGGMSKEDKDSLSKSMSALSKAAQDLGMQLPNLDQAMAALAANQTDLFVKDLQIAENELEKTKELAKSLQQMQMQMEKMGKDLPEQLKNGQADAAQSSLQKMIDKLQSGNLSKEEMQKMMDEVARSVDPASPYGKAAQHLKDAAKKLQSGGQKSDAAQSLAMAKKELDDLMQKMNDAKEMLAELQLLNQASQSIGTCTGWGECKNPGAGKGNKPGRGVGTWADEDSGWGYDGHQDVGWDNSGIQRPDTDGKGTTDRGEAELNSALRPDKVKGQFTPGGQMPSITLKGLSIKGQSTVSFQETAAAAQADAQSALSQEKVPRAYQGAVKDYFNDLKK